MEVVDIIAVLYIFVISTFAGFELIGKVPSTLHTPLMSGSNAISGITLIGALTSAGNPDWSNITAILGFLAIIAASVNVFGGYLVTNRMLKMFKKK